MSGRQIAGMLCQELPVERTVGRGQTDGANARVLDDPARTEAFIRGQHPGSSSPAYLLAKTVDLSPFGHLLDLGGGSVHSRSRRSVVTRRSAQWSLIMPASLRSPRRSLRMPVSSSPRSMRRATAPPRQSRAGRASRNSRTRYIRGKRPTEAQTRRQIHDSKAVLGN
jgi:hypothetical protein